MDKINLSKEDVSKLNKLKVNGHNNGGSLYVVGDKLYKIYGDVVLFPEEKFRNVNIVGNNSFVNIPKIRDLIYVDNKFDGYSMDYIKNSKTFREGIKDDIDDSKRVLIIKDIYASLKELHQSGIVLGDVHMDNFIYDNNHGYIIDLDNMRLSGDEFKFGSCYIIKKDKDHGGFIMEDKYTDNMKVAVVCLSFLHKVDLESIIMEHDIEYLKGVLESMNVDEKIIELFSNFDGNVLYLDDLINNRKLSRNR